MKTLFALFLTIVMSLQLKADSPLTSTYFAPAYKDVKAIARILEMQSKNEAAVYVIDSDCIAFLDAKKNPLDQKIALINAMGFGNTSNTLMYKNHIAAKYKISLASIDSLFTGSLESLEVSASSSINFTARDISDSDLLSLIYMQVLGDYFNPILAINSIDYLYSLNKENQAVALVGCLIAGQFVMDYDWCAVSHCTDVLYESNYVSDKMRPEALELVEAYIDLYDQSCIGIADSSGNGDASTSTVDGRVFDLDSFKVNPVYNVPSQRQTLSKSGYVDLVMVTKHDEKEMALGSWLFYNEETRGTEWLIEVKNAGNIASIETNLLVRIMTDPEDDSSSDGYYQQAVPVLLPGESTKIRIIIPNYWIYDPNAYFKIELDYDNVIEEKKEDNNSVTVFEMG